MAFPDQDHEIIALRRICFDQLTILKQLVGSLNKKNPRDLLKLGRAVIGLLSMSGAAPDPRLLDTTEPDLTVD